MQADVAFGIVIGLLFVCLLILFCVLVVKLYINKIKRYTKLIYEKDLEFQRTLTATILETQEEVLKNISQELHDDAGQQITFINFLVENLKFDAPHLEEPLQQLSVSVGNLSGSVRRISHSLSGQRLVQQNIVKAISTEVERLKQIKGLAINFFKETEVAKGFDPSTQIVIFRIFQEATNNILKHAEATQIDVSICTEPRFSLTVSDNGKGFNYAAVKEAANGMGLTTLENRAALVGFSVTIHSQEGSGTKISISEK